MSETSMDFTSSDLSEGLPGDFQALTEPYTRELLVHCYRFFGSLDDAEDALQETLLRAWRKLETLKERSALRAWLYRIATNVSLDMLHSLKTRALPPQLSAPYDPEEALPGPAREAESVWLQPVPDELLAGLEENPEAIYETRESVSFAFLTLLQRLPARQRAVLILRDVLGWDTSETAGQLEISAAAVNSALQRARATMNAGPTLWPEVSSTYTDASASGVETLLLRYVRAWEASDTAGLVALLRDDAILTMPPMAAWYQGKADIQRFYERHVFGLLLQGPRRLVAARANGCPAFAVYEPNASGIYRASALHVLSIVEDRIARVDTFLGISSRQLAQFGLNPTL